MKCTIEFDRAIYEIAIAGTDDGLDVLAAVGIDYRDVCEPLENVQQRLADAYRDGANYVEYETKREG